ncbi:MAG: hypothetical protein H0X54_03575 [Propionibacteriales bacterium]|nr:hypothetical protein [Propionibacteriales bacterium]
MPSEFRRSFFQPPPTLSVITRRSSLSAAGVLAERAIQACALSHQLNRTSAKITGASIGRLPDLHNVLMSAEFGPRSSIALTWAALSSSAESRRSFSACRDCSTAASAPALC